MRHIICIPINSGHGASTTTRRMMGDNYYVSTSEMGLRYGPDSQVKLNLERLSISSSSKNIFHPEFRSDKKGFYDNALAPGQHESQY